MSDSNSPLDPLDPVAIRILGSLMEKEITTPENYPLTLNALTAACNQISNRDPVMDLQESDVADGLRMLMERVFVRSLHRSDSRVLRYRQSFGEALHLHPAEVAVMCVLMLRGPQTGAEIRTRAARLFEFRDAAHLDVTLHVLLTLPVPLIAQLPRRAGQKEVRFHHMLSGEIPSMAETESSGRVDAAQATPPRSADRLAALEEMVVALQSEIAELRAEFARFRSEFQ